MECHTTETYLGNSRYCRTRSKPREELEHKLLEYYGVATHNPDNNYVAYVFPSGMSAISTIMQCFGDSKGSIVVGDELYCDSPKVAKYLTAKGFYKSVVQFSEVQETDVIRLIHLETCSNPSGKIPNYDKLTKLKQKHKCIICLDNTWLSGASFNPIKKYGDLIDVVVESTSKYISNGKCIGGMCVSREEHADVIFGHIRTYGIHVSQQVCEIVKKELENVEERLRKSSRNTEDILKQIGKKYEITYPEALQCKYKPSIFVVSIPLTNSKLGNQKRMDRMRENLLEICERHKIPFETSFGSSYSKIDTFPKMSKDKSKLHIRVYIGYEKDQDNIMNMLKELHN
jgi:cystathionine beta-lyase/cystathionine gamma-synthase